MPSKHTKSRRKELVNGQWEIIRLLGTGSFGQVYEVKNVVSGKRAAVKMEKIGPDEESLLQNEYSFYRDAGNNFAGFPAFYSYGHNASGSHRTLVISLLGPDLRGIFVQRQKQFSQKTVLMIALQGLKRLRQLHYLGFVHCDVKPANIILGKLDRDRIYFADLGLTRRFRHGGRHIPFQKNQGFAGTVLYASINVHSGYSISRRDDLESFGYCLLEFFTGTLPWRQSRSTEDIHQQKRNMPISSMCRNAPSVMKEFITYVRTLGFSGKPDHDFLESIFKNALKRRGLNDDRRFDWM